MKYRILVTAFGFLSATLVAASQQHIGDCEIGLEVRPGQSCSAGTATFTVSANGGTLRDGDEVVSARVRIVTEGFCAVRQIERDRAEWRIEDPNSERCRR